MDSDGHAWITEVHITNLIKFMHEHSHDACSEVSIVYTMRYLTKNF